MGGQEGRGKAGGPSWLPPPAQQRTVSAEACCASTGGCGGGDTPAAALGCAMGFLQACRGLC